MQKINEIVITGKIEVSDEIDKDMEYSLYLERMQNYEGRNNSRIDKFDREIRCYKMVNLGIVMLKQGDKIIMGKPKKGSLSQVMRFKLKELWEASYAGSIGEEEFYQKRMNAYIAQIEDEIAKTNDLT
jgi:hypothetical protein